MKDIALQNQNFFGNFGKNQILKIMKYLYKFGDSGLHGRTWVPRSPIVVSYVLCAIQLIAHLVPS